MEETKNSRLFTIEHLLGLQRVADCVPLHMSPDGRWLAASIQSQQREQPRSIDRFWGDDGVPLTMVASVVLIVDTTTGAIQTPFSQCNTSWSAQWSPDGRRIAAYVKDEGIACLGIWDSVTRDIQLWRHVQGRPAFGFEVPQWTPDSQAVVLKLGNANTTSGTIPIPSATEGVAPRVSVFSFDPAINNSGKRIESFLDWMVGDLAVVDVTSGTVKRLVSNWGFRCWRLSPDGQTVAVLKVTDCDSAGGQFYFNHELVVVPLDGSQPQTVADKVLQEYGISLSWSPDSQFLAYTTLKSTASGQTSHLYVVPVNDNFEPTQLSDDDDPSLTHPYESPRWSVDGKYIYCLTSAGVWAGARDGNAKRILTLSFSHQIRYWVQRPISNTCTLIDNTAIQFVVRNPSSFNEGLARLDLGSGEGRMITKFTKSCVGGLLAQEVAPDGSWYFVAEAADSPAEIWCVRGDASTPQRLCSLNSALNNVALGTSQLVEWRTLDGRKHQGALLLPPNYVKGQPLPLIVQVYGGFNGSELLHGFGFSGLHIDNAQLLASHGYAVLWPDLPMSDHDPLRQLPGLVLPALDYLIDQGIANPNRIGVIGHSYGGYNVMALLTQTTRFQAAVSMAGVVNLTSFYGIVTNKGDSAWLEWAESGQGRLGGTLWEKQAAYIENSPLFYLDRVDTPVLLVSGTAQPGEAAQACEAFSALRRLGKRVDLCMYDQEGHSPVYWSEESLHDLCERVLTWFDTYL